MAFLLKLKHWQLFLLTWGAGFLINLVAIINIHLIMYAFPVMMLLFCVGLFGWIWAIATTLFRQLPPDTNMNLHLFKLLFSIPILYMLAISVFMGVAMAHQPVLQGSAMLTAMVFIVPLHLLSMVCIFYGLRFAAKVLKSVELQREAHFGDYIGEFFLIWFSVVGVWILQPRISALVQQKQAGLIG
ncbi:hypothetical protein [Hymenobacter lucidus]|uniref:Uncharacterized protein n=1 Tax=Hymenobacter lucidus TaxID=2880930 RepID=A0ABS8ARJ8_9BACT|nr:hypothetical protein [Hymenobacter lucidus]MCB2408416.1 hypothetical protein [Hymenobacter lucidus]